MKLFESKRTQMIRLRCPHISAKSKVSDWECLNQSKLDGDADSEVSARTDTGTRNEMSQTQSQTVAYCLNGDAMRTGAINPGLNRRGMNISLSVNKVFWLIMLVSFMSSPILSAAQTDTLHLKNDTIIQGVILEKTPNHVRIKTKSGNIFTFKTDEIDRIEIGEVLPPIPDKDREPLIAALLSAIVPGAGQAYNAEYEKAFGFFGAWAAGFYLSVTAFEPQPEGKGVYIPHDNTSRFALGAFLTYGSALLGIVDAAIVRTQINQQRELRRQRLKISALNEYGSFGVRLAFQF